MPHLTKSITLSFLFLLFLLTGAIQNLPLNSPVSKTLQEVIPDSFAVTGNATVPPIAGNTTVSQAWLDEANVTWKPVTNTSVQWSALLETAGYNNIFSETNASIFSDLAMLVTTGVSCIRVDIGYDTWLLNNATAKTQMGEIVNQIKADGKCLIIADAGAESYRGGGKLSWSNYRTKWIARVGDLAGLYTPNYYVVIKEPTWYNAEVLVPSTTATDWNTLTVNLANSVLANSSLTKIGVAIPGNQVNVTWQHQWLANVSTQANVNFIGVDVYGINDYNNPIIALNSVPSPITKQIWITETGSTVSYPANNTQQIKLDPNWIQTVYYYCLYIGCTNIIPFWTNTLASYNQPVPNWNERTPWYSTFVTLIAGYSPPTTTTSNSIECAEFQTSTNGVLSSFTLMPIILLVSAAGGILMVIGGLQIKAGEKATGPPMVSLAVFITGAAIILVLGIYMTGYLQSSGLTALGC